ncbi:MAG: ComEC/Rec2 family competence protein [Alphaproteobacteria bacterium]|nr:ComEC/Rec2 family competence protein [Alphaproteobacteria bacterium]
MSEAAKPGEMLRRWDWRDAARWAVAFVAGLPRAIAEGWRADAGRRVLFVPVLMGVGIGGYFALPFEPAAWTIGVGVVAVLVWVAVRRFDVHVAAVSVAAIVAGICSGFSLAVVRAQTNDIVVLASETRMLTITGRVARLEPAERGRTRVWLDVETTKPSLRQTPRRIRISINKKTEALSPGGWIEVRATLKPLPAPVAPGSYDFGRKLWFDGIGAVGFSLSPVVKIDTPRDDSFGEALDSAVQDVRRAVSERILAAMSPRTGPIAAAFLTGERGLISDEDNEAMRDSSLAHLLSISGLHMALAGFGFFMALRLIFAMIPAIVLNYPVKKWAAAAAIVASFAYLLLSGASVPTQRAFVMITVALVAILFDRSALNMRSVAVAAVIILAVTPEAWIDPSFQMSFAAVVALIAAYEWWNERRIGDVEPRSVVRTAWGMLLGAAATSFIAGLASAPLAAFHFNRFADYGVAANVMVTPIVSFLIMPAGVFALLLMPFGLEAIPLAAMEVGLDAMLWVAHWVASWPGATVAVGAWPIEGLLLIVAGGLWLAIWMAKWRWFGVVAVAVGLAVLPTARVPDVLIAADGDNVAFRDADGALHLLSSRRGRFDAEIWLRRDGDSREVSAVTKDDDGGFMCDAAGCVAQVAGRAPLLVAFNAEALVEDCSRVAVVIDLARGWRPPCDGPQVLVTRGLLRREGAIEIRLEDGRVVWTSVARERGARPWAGSAQ